MTHSNDAPLPPPTTAGSAPGTGSPATTDVAKSEAKNVGQTAAQAGSQVASVATDQAKEVVQETQRQAQDLLQQARSRVREQALSQQQKAAQGLSSVAQQLRGMAEGTSDGAPGPARDLLHEASGKLEEVGAWLRNREPADVLEEVRSFARRKPGPFLLGAALAGAVAGRLTRGIHSAHTDSGTGDSFGTGDPPSGPSQWSSVDVDAASRSTHGAGYDEGIGYVGSAGPTLPPSPYAAVPPTGSAVPPGGWDDPAGRPGGVSER